MDTQNKTTRLIWRDRMTFDATTASGHPLTLSGSAGEFGSSRGPTPIELLLTALGGCTAMDVLAILEKKREPIRGLEVEVSGTRAAEHPRIYTDIEVVYRVLGNVNPAAVERAIELSRTKYCSVEAMLRKSARITARFEIHPEELPEVEPVFA